MWTKSENSEPIKPLEIEYSGNYVIVRKDFVFVVPDNGYPAHYEYMEWQMTKEQYDVYEAINNAQPANEQALMARYASV